MLRGALARYRLRVARGVEQHGVLGLVRHAVGRVLSRDEAYVWYVLDLRRLEPMAFREGYVLRRASLDDVELLRKVPAIPVDEGRRRIEAGEQVWFVFKDDEPVFACSAFVNVLPLEAARKGRYELPPRRGLHRRCTGRPGASWARGRGSGLGDDLGAVAGRRRE